MTTNEVDAWTLLGDPSRRGILEVLSARPSSVAELADELPISRPAVSQHLKLLKGAGVVADRPEGTRRIYSVDADRLAHYRAQLDLFWRSTLAGLERVASTDPAAPPGPPARSEGES